MHILYFTCERYELTINMETSDNCPVCLQNFHKTEFELARSGTSTILRQTLCKHIFCHNCFDKCKGTNRCPLCRSKMVTDEEARVADPLPISDELYEHYITDLELLRILLLGNILFESSYLLGEYSTKPQLNIELLQTETNIDPKLPIVSLGIMRTVHNITRAQISEVCSQFDNCSSEIAIQAIAQNGGSPRQAITYLRQYTHFS